jgi:cytochrome c-type biogenesis protein CcmH
VIGARVSKAGDAMPASGDLQGFSSPVKVGSSGVDVRIDQVVP